jgi:hypothetical protein
MSAPKNFAPYQCAGINGLVIAKHSLATARGSRDDNDSLAGLIVTFFSGICLEQNLGPDRVRITKKIDAFMRLIRAI